MKYFFLPILLFPFLLLSIISNAQQNKIDSLHVFLKAAKADTNKVNALNNLSAEYRGISDFKLAFQYALQARNLAEKIWLPGEKEQGWPKGAGNAINSMGITCYRQGNYKPALEYYMQALVIREKINDKLGIANSYNNIGLIYSIQGNNEKALENHLKSLKIMEEAGNKKGIGNSYNNIGMLYFDRGNYTKSLENHLKALKIKQEMNDKFGEGSSYNNIGNVYERLGVAAFDKKESRAILQKGLESHLLSLKIKEELDDKQGISASFNNIGNIYLSLGDIMKSEKDKQSNYQKSLDNYLKAMQIAIEIGDKQSMQINYNCIGNIYIKQNKLDDSEKNLKQSLTLAKELDYKNGIQDAYSYLSDLYNKKKEYKEALEYLKLYTNIKDTLLSEASSKQIAEMNAKYDTEKKDKELILKDAEITKQQAQSEKRQTQRNAFIIGFGLVLVLVLFVFRSNRQKKEANIILENKNEAISKQNSEIEKKNTVITDSIEYAKNIQQAILPSEEELKKHLPNHFILYKPKDIVSGDFYWIHEQVDRILFAVADCTGHGVPGAFMSLLGHNLLKEVVNKGIYTPSEILNELNLNVLKTLKQDDKNTSAKYGMDIAMISFDKKKNTIEFAGAHNPLYIFRNLPAGQEGQECIRLKGDARAIGSSPKEGGKGFSNQPFQLQKGDMLYLFSDGYTDQMGGPENKKFLSKPFRELLLSIFEKELSEQQQLLDTNIVNWQGNKKQTDDILVVGIRV